MDEQSLFAELVDLPDPDARSARLDAAAAGNPKLRERMERLLARHAAAGSFLVRPVTPDGMLTLTQAVEPDASGTTIGPYKLRELIGEGGMGAVYVAEQTEPVRRRVAVKVVKPGMDSKAVVARFEAERQALALMDHPNIARVFDGGTTDAGRPYFVMELVRGLPITDYCDGAKLPIRERLALFVQVCRAVQHAHTKGVIHRDLKPSNVLVTVIDGVPVPKVIDFGVAKATGGTLTERTLFTGFHQLVGTPLYMAPEQAEMSGVDVDTRADVYALGVLLYELLTGTTPFDPEVLRTAGFDEMRRMIREDEPARPSRRVNTLAADKSSTVADRRGVDPRRLGRLMQSELDWVVMRALDKDRNRRYETAGAFAADIERYLADAPVEACPPSVRYRFGKFARRNRAALTGGLAVAVALIAGMAVSAWQAVRATRAEGRAEARYEQARQAVDDMYTGVAERWLSQQGSLTSLQREFLEKALAFYKEAAEHRPADPQTRLSVAHARYRVGRIHDGLGQFTEAEAALRRAVEDLEALLANHPDKAKCQWELAEWCVNLGGTLLRSDRPAEAMLYLKRSVTLRESLATEPLPLKQPGLMNLANSHLELGKCYARLSRFPQAEEALSRAREVHTQLRSDAKWEPAARSLAANCENHLGIVYVNTNRLTEAEQAFRRAIALHESVLAGESPVRRVSADKHIRHALAIALLNLSLLELKTDRQSQGSETIRRAIGLLEAQAAETPNDAVSLGTLAQAEGYLVIYLIGAQRGVEAEQVGRRAIDRFDTIARSTQAKQNVRPLAKLLALMADIHSARPESPLYDPQRAVTLARRAVELNSSEDGIMWQSLGWALYRVGDWNGCLDALRHQRTYDRDGDFFGAMSHWQLGDKAAARQVFDRADKWLSGYEKAWKQATHPPLWMIRQFRTEAAALLGIQAPADQEKSNPISEPK